MEIIVGELAEACGGRFLSGGRQSGFPVPGVSTDTRTLKKGEIFIALEGPNYDGHDFMNEAFAAGALGAVVSRVGPGAPEGAVVVVVDDTMEALYGLAAYYRGKFNVPVIGVTGSTGKTTTKEMLSCVLSEKYTVLKTQGNFNNLIGLPLTIFRLESGHQACVFELGMSASGELRRLSKMAKPDIGIITKIGPAHLENFESMTGIACAKAELLNEVSKAVLNIDDEYYGFLRNRFSGEVKTFGLGRGADFRAENISAVDEGCEFLLNGSTRIFLPVRGMHNALNALSAIAASSYLGIGPEEAAGGLEKVSALPMRLEFKRLGGITVIDDAYNANPQSMAAALDVLAGAGGRKIAVLGDMLELGSRARLCHEEAGRIAAEKSIDMFFAVGEYAEYAAGASKAAGVKMAYSFKSKKQLISKLLGEIAPGDTILIKGSRAAGMEEVVKSLETRGSR